MSVTTFLGLEETAGDYERSSVVILPLPYERTTSYGRGTAGGPQALLNASSQVELYDLELQAEPHLVGIATLPPFLPQSQTLEGALGEIEAEALRHLEAGKRLIAVGGEHSLTPALVRATRRARGELGVVQFDAHADLRSEYEGTPFSHACAMRRILDLGVPTLAVGVRSLSAGEADLVHEHELPVIWGHQLEGADAAFEEALAALPERVYLTFDLDYFDPALVPGTGTPEPGGGAWHPTLKLLRTLFHHKRVEALDVVELAPIPGQPAGDFLAAKLVYKCIAYLSGELSPPASRLVD